MLARNQPTEIAKQLGISRPTVYAIMKSETVERKAGLGTRKMRLTLEKVKDAAKSNPLKSMREHAKEGCLGGEVVAMGPG